MGKPGFCSVLWTALCLLACLSVSVARNIADKKISDPVKVSESTPTLDFIVEKEIVHENLPQDPLSALAKMVLRHYTPSTQEDIAYDVASPYTTSDPATQEKRYKNDPATQDEGYTNDPATQDEDYAYDPATQDEDYTYDEEYSDDAGEQDEVYAEDERYANNIKAQDEKNLENMDDDEIAAHDKAIQEKALLEHMIAQEEAIALEEANAHKEADANEEANAHEEADAYEEADAHEEANAHEEADAIQVMGKPRPRKQPRKLRPLPFPKTRPYKPSYSSTATRVRSIKPINESRTMNPMTCPPMPYPGMPYETMCAYPNPNICCIPSGDYVNSFQPNYQYPYLSNARISMTAQDSPSNDAMPTTNLKDNTPADDVTLENSQHDDITSGKSPSDSISPEDTSSSHVPSDFTPSDDTSSDHISSGYRFSRSPPNGILSMKKELWTTVNPYKLIPTSHYKMAKNVQLPPSDGIAPESN